MKSRIGRQFRIFADHNKADRAALAACMVSSREPMTEAQVRQIDTPVLVANGEQDDMAGPAAPLASLLRSGDAFTIRGATICERPGIPRSQAALDFLSAYS